MAGQHTKIIATDYNTIQKKISAVLGDGGTDPNTNEADSTFGYGQAVLSNQVSVNAKISSNQWRNLQTDIIKARQHQTGINEKSVTVTATTATSNLITTTTTTSTAVLFVGQSVVFSGSLGNLVSGKVYYVHTISSTTQFMVSESLTGAAFSLGTATGSITAESLPTEADSIIEARRPSYNDMSDLCITHKLIMPPSTEATRTAYVQTYSNPWNGTLTHKLTLDFSSHVRFFFNSGGFFEMFTSKTTGTGGAKNNSWTTMLANIGTLRFGRTETTRTAPDNGPVTVVSSIGYATISTADQLIYQKLTETPTYTPNQYAIYVRQGSTTSQLVLTITFADLSGQPNYPYGTDESIDGTVTSTVEMYRASGDNVSIPAPTVNNGIVAT